MSPDNFTEVERHNHDGVNSPRLDPRNFIGYQIVTAAPTHASFEGAILLGNIAGTYKLYAYINGAWRATTLT